MSDEPSRETDEQLAQRMDDLERQLIRLRGQFAAMLEAQEERLSAIGAAQREQLDAMAAARAEQLQAMAAAQADRLDAQETLLVEQLRVARAAREEARDSAGQRQLGERLEGQGDLLRHLDARLQAVLDRLDARDLEHLDQLAALEAAIADQRHAFGRTAAASDKNAYNQRLEFQRRLADLMNSLVDQRQELHAQITGIEAGLSDLRILLTGPGAARSSGEVEAGDPPGSGASTAVAAGGGDLERKLGIVIDCMLADHVAGQARAGRDAGDLEEEAYLELVRALEELKLERLRGRHLPPGSSGEDEGDA